MEKIYKLKKSLKKIIIVITISIIHVIIIFYPIVITQKNKDNKEIKEIKTEKLSVKLIKDEKKIKLVDNKNQNKIKPKESSYLSVNDNYVETEIQPKHMAVKKVLNVNHEENKVFLEDEKKGEVTQLNTIKLKYFNFYNRIKKQVEKQWLYNIEIKQNKFELISGKKETILVLKINREGVIEAIKIGKESGVSFIDEIAIDSMKKTKQFSDTPQELFNGKEFLYLYWGFVLNI